MKNFLYGASRIVMAEAAAEGGAGTGGATPAPSPSPSASPAPSPTGQPAGPAWLSADQKTPENLAYLQSKGWDKADNPTADIFRSYQALEKHFGADRAGNTVVVPGANADEKAWGEVYNRLGRPDKPENYKIAVPEKNGDPEFAKEFGSTAHKLGLSQKQVEGLSTWWNEKSAGLFSKAESDANFNRAQGVQKIKDEWGAAYDSNSQIVNEAANALGLDDKQVLALGNVMGVDGAMRMLHKIGTKTGDGKFISGDNSRGPGDAPMTPQQANDELGRLAKDEKWMAAWMSNTHPEHKAAVARKSQLTAWASAKK